jgi:acyl-CoA reductase-like NAD-dependent aldehyde dehydrogenase
LEKGGEGEVQEMIDIADFALGQSRMLYGLGMHSERPDHRMYEHWHPLGPVGVITAFNFQVAVWSWNALIALVADDTVIYRQIKIGGPLKESVLMGPLIDTDATAALQAALAQIKDQGGKVLYGGTVLNGGLYDAGTYVIACICEARADMPIVQAETSAPLL